MRPPLDFLEAELEGLRRDGLLRANVSLDSPTGPRVRRGGRELINFSSNDYLALANDPAIKRAAAETALAHGAGAGASRLLGGDLPIHRELEAALSALKGTAACLLFGSGFQANCGILPALAGEGDAIFSDALNHASIVDGCRLSRARHFVYRHGDLDHLASLLGPPARRKLIVSESLFSMDGDVAPLLGLCELAERNGALLMIDEAHATGLYGQGAGLCRELGIDGRVAIQMGTLGKALGSAGAYVAGEGRVIEFLINRCRSYLFSTALSPPACGAALAALQVVCSPEGRRRRDLLARSAARLATQLRARGLPVVGGERHLMAVQLGAPERAVAASEALEARGFLVRAVRPPTVPHGTSRLRLSLSAGHLPEEIDRLVDALAEVVDDGAVLPA